MRRQASPHSAAGSVQSLHHTRPAGKAPESRRGITTRQSQTPRLESSACEIRFTTDQPISSARETRSGLFLILVAYCSHCARLQVGLNLARSGIRSQAVAPDLTSLRDVMDPGSDHATGSPSVSVNSRKLPLNRAVISPARPPPMIRPSTLTTGASSPIVPEQKHSSARYSSVSVRSVSA